MGQRVEPHIRRKQKHIDFLSKNVIVQPHASYGAAAKSIRAIPLRVWNAADLARLHADGFVILRDTS